MDTKDKQVRHLSFKNVDLQTIKTVHKDVFMYDDALITKNISKENSQNVIKEGEIYRTGEHRILTITQGEINITLNLNTVTLHAGDILYLSKGVLVQMNNVSNDACGKGILFSDKYISENIIEQNSAVVLHPADKDIQYNKDLFDLLWQTSQKEYFSAVTFIYLFKSYVANVFFYVKLIIQPMPIADKDASPIEDLIISLINPKTEATANKIMFLRLFVSIAKNTNNTQVKTIK